jgi:5-formyltetrahydrofolate cyclo-ligase
MSTSKTELRQSMRVKRRTLTPAEQVLAARKLAARVVATRLFRVSRRIACYLPNDGEIDPSDIIERIWRMKKLAFLPVLSHISTDRLWFAQVEPGMELVANRYGIAEPHVPRHALIRAHELDLVLLPLVAFDSHGHRLGMGGGFYDRSLAFLRHRQHLAKPHLLGLAHDFQRVERCPADPWDIPLNGVVSDRALYTADA